MDRSIKWLDECIRIRSSWQAEADKLKVQHQEEKNTSEADVSEVSKTESSYKSKLPQLFAVVQGGTNMSARETCAKAMAQRSVAGTAGLLQSGANTQTNSLAWTLAGFVVGGLHTGESPQQRQAIIQAVLVRGAR